MVSLDVPAGWPLKRIFGNWTIVRCILLNNGLWLKEKLLKFGMMALTWKEYSDGEHWVNEPQGIDDIVNFVRKTHVRLQQTCREQMQNKRTYSALDQLQSAFLATVIAPGARS